MIDWRQRFWSGDERRGFWLAFAATLLAPLEWAYRLVVGARNWAFDRGLASSNRPAIPSVVVGNLTVGGTGKTPFTAWLTAELRARGRTPAVVTRGYGADEVMVHRLLNPETPVVVSVGRVAGVSRAIARGADIAVLDDAFQHRRLEAHVYLVLVAAEEWSDRPRLLPRGPWREPLTALKRATLVIVTRKDAGRQAADAVRSRLRERSPDLPAAQVHLALKQLYRFQGEEGLADAVSMAGFRAPLAVAGVARPQSVWRQLHQAGVSAEERWGFPDHHRYSAKDVGRIVERAGAGPLILTLKDAVKLHRAIPERIATYVPLQEVLWEAGREELETLLADVAGAGSAREVRT